VSRCMHVFVSFVFEEELFFFFFFLCVYFVFNSFNFVFGILFCYCLDKAHEVFDRRFEKG